MFEDAGLADGALCDLTTTSSGDGSARPAPPRMLVVTTFDLDEYVDAAVHHGAC